MSKSAQRKVSYRLILHETFHISYIVDVKQASIVNNSRKRARIRSAFKNRNNGGRSDKTWCFRQKTFRKQVALAWALPIPSRRIKKILAI